MRLGGLKTRPYGSIPVHHPAPLGAEKAFERDRFLFDEAFPKLALRKQLQHADEARRGGELDGVELAAVDRGAVHFLDETALLEPAAGLIADDADVEHHDVRLGERHLLVEDLRDEGRAGC